MNHLLLRLFACACVSVDEEYAERFLNFLLQNGIKSWGYNRAGGSFSFFVGVSSLALVRGEASRIGASVYEVVLHGLFPYCKQNRSRFGLLLGLLLSALLLYASSLVVWDVRISGNESLSFEEVRAELSAAGLDVGTHIGDFDRMRFSSELLSSSETLSFVGVNFHGTVAYVQVMERKTPEKEELPVGGANLIATADAVVESLAVVRGDPVVSRGDVVRAGDLLVSGVTEGAGGSHFVYAKGEILGRVAHEFTVVVPRMRRKTVESEEKIIGVSLNFFGKSINIYRDTGNLPTEYVTIYKETPMTAKGGVRLPFSLSVEYAILERCEDVPLSDADTVRYAEQAMKEKLGVAMQGKELLQKSVSGAFSSDSYTLTYRVITLENIARVSEFSIYGDS